MSASAKAFPREETKLNTKTVLRGFVRKFGGRINGRHSSKTQTEINPTNKAKGIKIQAMCPRKEKSVMAHL